MTTRTTAEWIKWCEDFNVPNSPVVSLDQIIDDLEIAEHPHGGRFRRIPHPIKFSVTPATVRREAPLPGEHNDEILREAGYSQAQIEDLLALGGLFEGELRPR